MQHAAIRYRYFGLYCHHHAGTIYIACEVHMPTASEILDDLHKSLGVPSAGEMLFSTLTAACLASSVSAATIDIAARQDDTSGYRIHNLTLDTPWTSLVGTNPWPEYPRPRLQRSLWKNLNGVWRYRNGADGDLQSPPFGQTLEDPVLVPFCLESALSGT